MNARLLIDAGPLVALLLRRDKHHQWSIDRLRGIVPPIRNCEAALAEALHFLEHRADSSRALRQMLERGFLEVDFSLREDMPAVIKLMDRYASLPMSLADACLVRMCELDQQATLLTIDRDFLVYRKNGREALRLLMPSMD